MGVLQWERDAVARKQDYVSVVIPCLNRARFLVPTIESILQQDYPRVECIVVDGGSKDGTVEILKQYGDRIRWVSERDRGQAAAINKGWRSQAVAYMEKYPEVDVVYGDCGSIDVEGNVIGEAYLHEWDLGYAVEHCDHCIPQPAAFIRRRVLGRVGWLDASLLLMDWDLWYRIGAVGTIRHLPAVLAYARRIPSYWDSKGDVAAENCVRITRKFFELPYCPEGIRKKRRRAISNSYLRGTEYAFEKGRHWRTIFSHMFLALLADPTNSARIFACVRGLLEIGSEEDMWIKAVFLALRTIWFPRKVCRRLKARAGHFGSSRGPSLEGDHDIE
jgi:glycosyltransferase involved in cell wall biosynthesis